MTPSPSVMLEPPLPTARDPLGLNNSLGVSTKKEPVGAIPPERSPLGGNDDGIPLPPTPTRRNYPAPTPLMAMLVGAPPPPPDTPPPKKRRSASSRRRKTKDWEGSRQTDGEQPPTPVSVDDGNESLGMVSPSTTTTTSRRQETEEDKRIAAVMEKRLNEARAIYQSETMVLDPPIGEHLTGRPSKAATPKVVTQQENNVPAFSGSPRKTVGDLLLPSPVQGPVPPPSSPTSTSTEQMGNHSAAPLSQAAPLSPRQNEDNSIPKTEELASAKTPKAGTSAKKRPKTPQRIRRALTPSRSRTADERKATSANHRRSNSVAGKSPAKSPARDRRRSTGEGNDSSSKPGKKGGFFRKIFGKRKAKPASNGETDSVTVATDGKSYLTSPKQSSMLTNQQEQVQGDVKYMPMQGVTFASSDEDQAGTNDGAGEERPDFFFAHDEVSTLTAPTYEPQRRADPVESSAEAQAMSDPMGHYFPHTTFSKSADEAAETSSTNLMANTMPSFDPFTAPFFDETQIDYVVTQKMTNGGGNLNITVETAFDPVGESPHHHKLANLLQEENASRPTIKDPSPRGQATMLYSVQDPSPRGQERMPDPSPKVQMQKPTPLTIQDPSPRGYQTPSFADHPVQDPFGESPLHKNQRGPSALRDGSPYAPDPPLHLSNLDMSVVSDGSSNQEEKKDEEFVSLAEDSLSFKRLTPPPSPSPPPPRMAASPPPRPPSPAHRARSPRTRSGELLRSSSVQRSHGPSAERKPPMVDVVSHRETIASAAASPVFLRRQRRAPLAHNESQKSTKKPVEEKSPFASSDKERPQTERERVSGFGGPVDSDLILEEEEASRAGMEIDIGKKEDDETTVSDTSTLRTSATSTSNSKRASKKLLTMSVAARMNAKAVAYIHTLNGEPSPRNVWRGGMVSDDEASPANHALKKRGDSLGDFTNPTKTPPPASSARTTRNESNRDDTHLFVAYNNKFKSRKAGGKSGAVARATEFRKRIRNRTTPDKKSPSASNIKIKMARDGTPADSFAIGVRLLREKREDGIRSGRLQRVILDQVVATPKVRSYFDSMEEPEPRDPIQRAGRRLLSKAAVPIQAAARRFLAQREAVDRMWALIEIQSYFRRWKAQASLLAHQRSAIVIQKSFRAMRVRSALRLRNEAATNIQRMVRGYIAAIHTFDTVFMIILIQAKARGNLVRDRVRRMKEEALRIKKITSVQSVARGYIVRARLSREREEALQILKAQSTLHIQTWWRCRTSRVSYQFLVVDVIIAQSVVRRWRAESKYKAIIAEKQNKAATKIQSLWRGFQGYTDYIFALVDVIVVQRTARQWLAKRRVAAMRRDRAATVIQSHVRRYAAQMSLLYSLVQIIMVQSTARRYLAKNALNRKRNALTEDNIAATKIQAVWRGFWKCSNFVIMQYEATRIQAFARGVLVRKTATEQLGSCIMIQSAARRFLAFGAARAMRVSRASVTARAEALRERHASTRIQFWWRIVLDCRKEKAAALVIERFFLMVKREVDREIARVARKRSTKRSSRRRRKKEPHEKMLERVWLNTVDEERNVGSFGYSPSESSGTPMSRMSPHSQSSSRSRRHKSEKKSKNSSHRLLSPSMKPVMRNASSRSPSLGKRNDALNFSYSAESEISASTASLAALYRTSSARKSSMSRSEMSDDLSLEEAYLDTAVEQGKERKRSAEKYMKMYGIRGSPQNPVRRVNHFFADDLESTMTGLSSGSSIRGIKYTSSQSASGTPTNSDSLLVSPASGTRLSSPLGSPVGRMRSPQHQTSPRYSGSPRNPYSGHHLSKRGNKREPRKKEEEYGLI